MVLANSSSKAAITFQIKVDSLEQMPQIEDSIASSLQHLDLVIYPFHKSTVVAVYEVICDLIQNWLQVLTCAKLSKVNECEGDEFEAEMIFLFCLKA